MCNCNSLLQNNKPNFNVIAAKMPGKKSRILSNSKIFSKTKEFNSGKNYSIISKHEYKTICQVSSID
jgi:hypothetical protein